VLNVSSTLALVWDFVQARVGIWKCWFLRREENQSTQRNTSRSREENQQQTQPTYDAGSGNTGQGHIGGRGVLSLPHHPCSPDDLAYLLVQKEYQLVPNDQTALFLSPDKLKKVFFSKVVLCQMNVSQFLRNFMSDVLMCKLISSPKMAQCFLWCKNMWPSKKKEKQTFYLL